MTESATPAKPGALVNKENPWPGLLAFQEADQEYFHGRGPETESLFRMVMRDRLTVMFGLSGLGKSSLLQAGLFPRARGAGLFPVYIRLDFTAPDQGLTGQILTAIAKAAEAAGIEAPKGAPGETLWEYFHRQDADFWNNRNRPVVPLLAFDQFEEVFTLGRGSEKASAATAELLDQLADLAEGRPPASLKAYFDQNPEAAKAFVFSTHRYKVLLTIREDFLPELEMLRPRAPSIGLSRFRLQRMDGNAALSVVLQAPDLVSKDVAEQIVRFVATAEGDQPLEDLEVEPALLSVICRELNEGRKAAGAPMITAALLEGSREQVLNEFYERSMADLAPEVRRFVEDDLLTVSGYRDSVALENALNTPGVTRDAINALVARRLVRREERGGVERLELTHDLLCGVVRASRDRRRQAEAADEQRRQERLALEEAAERERQERARKDLKRTRTAAAVFLLLTVAAIGAAFTAYRLRSEAERERGIAQSASVTADEQRKRAEQALETIQRSLQIRQAALSNDTATLDRLLSSLNRSTQLRFRSTANYMGYRNPSGQQVYRFELFPDPQSVPKGDDGVAFVTYLADHPTFHNTLMTAGPDRGFRATYIGWGCLSRIVALVEYRNPAKPPAVTEFDMCSILGW